MKRGKYGVGSRCYSIDLFDDILSVDAKQQTLFWQPVKD